MALGRFVFHALLVGVGEDIQSHIITRAASCLHWGAFWLYNLCMPTRQQGMPAVSTLHIKREPDEIKIKRFEKKHIRQESFA